MRALQIQLGEANGIRNRQRRDVAPWDNVAVLAQLGLMPGM
jgi:hypothetical protein